MDQQQGSSSAEEILARAERLLLKCQQRIDRTSQRVIQTQLLLETLEMSGLVARPIVSGKRAGK
jgi:hypothetical protein